MRVAAVITSFTLALVSLAAAPPAKVPAKPGTAQHGSATPVSGKGDPYSVTVPVDASAASASAAQNNAINSGRSKAWTELSHRFVPKSDWAKIPSLDSPALERLVRGYTVDNEKRSTTRYVARITYVFNPNAVKHLFRVANIGVSEPTGSSILLVAMSPTYSSHSAWTQAVAAAGHISRDAPLVVPVGDEVDQSTLGGVRFGSAGWGQIQPAAARVHAAQAILLLATNPAARKLTVHLRQVGPGRPLGLGDVEVPVPSGMPAEKVYATAAEQAEAAIIAALKSKAPVDVAKRSKVLAEVRILSPEQWVELQRRLIGVPTVGDFSLVAINTGEARVAFSYAGTRDQLRSALNLANLSTIDRGGLLWISSGRPDEPEPPDTAE